MIENGHNHLPHLPWFQVYPVPLWARLTGRNQETHVAICIAKAEKICKKENDRIAHARSVVGLADWVKIK
jgi:hypothetical protein